jgi:hypothetical protein
MGKLRCLHSESRDWRDNAGQFERQDERASNAPSEAQPSCVGQQRRPFVVRESEVERAQEIADEFYPQNKTLLEEQTVAIIETPGNAELCARICELARMLKYHPVKTRLLVGQWRQDLVGLERRLQNELDEGPQLPPEDSTQQRKVAGHLLSFFFLYCNVTAVLLTRTS